MNRRTRRPTRLVYSTDGGRHCPECSRPLDRCECNQPTRTAAVPDSVVRVRLETKARRGKEVTVVTGLPGGLDELRALGRELKKRCGTGGTVKDGVIEIQGDRRELLVTELEGRGFRVKRVG